MVDSCSLSLLSYFLSCSNTLLLFNSLAPKSVGKEHQTGNCLLAFPLGQAQVPACNAFRELFSALLSLCDCSLLATPPGSALALQVSTLPLAIVVLDLSRRPSKQDSTSGHIIHYHVQCSCGYS